MRVIYDGPFDEVEVPALGGQVFARGDAVEVPDDIGLALVEQECWTDPAAAQDDEPPPAPVRKSAGSRRPAADSATTTRKD